MQWDMCLAWEKYMRKNNLSFKRPTSLSGANNNMNNILFICTIKILTLLTGNVTLQSISAAITKYR